MEGKRFIEVSFPVREVSEISGGEKNIRHGHISTLHIWWARRPLASSRATNYAALIPAEESEEDLKRKRDFIVKLCEWKNSNNSLIIDRARKDVLRANNGVPPRVLDPFSGGGSIPLEALRLGCEVHAVEYNPVAVLILKCTLEYPQRYRGPAGAGDSVISSSATSPLLEDVKKWGNWVLEEARKEIGKFYPKDGDGSVPVGYIWARTLPCQNPACGAEIPLMMQFWLAKKKDKKVALYPYVEGGDVRFRIVGDGYGEWPEGFDPSKGTVCRAVVTCPVCGHVMDDKTTRRLFREGKSGERLVAVVLHRPGEKGKRYRLATEQDLKVFRAAEEHLEEKRAKLMEEWGIDPVPDEPTPEGRGRGAERAFSVRKYGLNKWGDLFNPRQKLALITFAEKVRLAYRKMVRSGYDEDYARAVVSYLGIGVNNIAEKNNNISRWANTKETIAGLFSRQALSMVWDYFESNIFSGATGDWSNSIKYIAMVFSHVSQIPLVLHNGETIIPKVTQASATELPYPDNYFDAVFTDPPYYDNVPYSYLSDFFYVWLKRSIGDLYPDLFVTPLTPKSKEIVAYTHDKGGYEAGKKFFEEMLKKSFREIARVLKPEGIATIVYTHKSTSGWETLINSLLESDLVVTASWPIDTEMKARLRAKESAALASSIYFVCRKVERKGTGWLNDVREEIRQYLERRLDELWRDGVSGADYFIAAIGSAIEVFGKYKKIMDYEGNEVSAREMIEYIRKLVTEYAVKKILHNGIAGELSPLTRFYILWRWTYGESKVHFDDARKLAQSTGVDLEKEWGRGFIRKEKSYVRVLGPQDRKVEEIKEDDLIDVLHKALLLWKDGKKEELKELLRETGYGGKEFFYRVAQAISETLPNESREKKLLDGFLGVRQRLMDEIKDGYRQKKLFE